MDADAFTALELLRDRAALKTKVPVQAPVKLPLSVDEAIAGLDAAVVRMVASGVSLVADGELPAAIDYFLRAQSLRPRDEHIMYMLSCAYALKGAPDLCMRWLQAAVVAASEHADARLGAKKLALSVKYHVSPCASRSCSSPAEQRPQSSFPALRLSTCADEMCRETSAGAVCAKKAGSQQQKYKVLAREKKAPAAVRKRVVAGRVTDEDFKVLIDGVRWVVENTTIPDIPHRVAERLACPWAPRTARLVEAVVESEELEALALASSQRHRSRLKKSSEKPASEASFPPLFAALPPLPFPATPGPHPHGVLNRRKSGAPGVKRKPQGPPALPQFTPAPQLPPPVSTEKRKRGDPLKGVVTSIATAMQHVKKASRGAACGAELSADQPLLPVLMVDIGTGWAPFTKRVVGNWSDVSNGKAVPPWYGHSSSEKLSSFKGLPADPGKEGFGLSGLQCLPQFSARNKAR
ncbi:hypothetical protein DIPPA_35514 [Diplonema papillatum]|nr:hypothetical protein DIPPA_35514 [Diplonema papillatum]